MSFRMTYNEYIRKKGFKMTYFVLFGTKNNRAERRLSAYAITEDLNDAFAYWMEHGFYNFRVVVENH